MGIHSGHRERMKQRFRETGFDGFSDVNALELLLFYAIPRQDTNPIAHALLDRFGSFHGVIDAHYEDLLKVNGVGENTALFLKMIPAVCKRYTQGKQKKQKSYLSILTNTDIYWRIKPLCRIRRKNCGRSLRN